MPNDTGVYQFLPPLRDEERDALEADIVARGVLVPVEVDEAGEILDGHYRRDIAEKHKLPYETIVRHFKTEGEKKEHAIKLNLARRHLEPYAWGLAFGQLLEVKGAQKGPGAPCKGENAVTFTALCHEVGVDPETARKRVQASRKFRALPKAKRRAVERGKMKLPAAIREAKREAAKANLENVAAKEAKAVRGVFDVLVIDPSWPMEKIERDERPNQAAMDYPTMTEEELAATKLPAADDCHVWLWTTHRFLPMALRLLDVWKLKYVCTFVWHKPGGFQPVGLPQYNCEFALYARRGSPMFIDTKEFPVCFRAPRGKHSEKPEAFYDVVRRVTAGRRLDMFARRTIEGFDAWGKEAPE